MRQDTDCKDRRRVDDLTAEDIKQAVKEGQREGAKEWLSEQKRSLEKATFKAVVSLLGAIIVYGIFYIANTLGLLKFPGGGG